MGSSAVQITQDYVTELLTVPVVIDAETSGLWKYFQLPKCQDFRSISFGIKEIIPYFLSRRLG
jgi:hypothetical protein